VTFDLSAVKSCPIEVELFQYDPILSRDSNNKSKHVNTLFM